MAFVTQFFFVLHLHTLNVTDTRLLIKCFGHGPRSKKRVLVASSLKVKGWGCTFSVNLLIIPLSLNAD